MFLFVKKKLFLISIIFSVFINTNLTAGVSTPKPTNINLISKIASATSFTSVNNNNTVINNSGNKTSKIISEKELRENVARDAAQLGLKVDEAALDALTSEENFSTAGLGNLADAVGFEDMQSLPDKTPDTWVYDTGWMELTRDTNYANKSIFSTASGAQKGRVQIFIDFKRSLFWGDVIAKPTVNSNAIQDGSTDYANPNLGTAAITAIPVTGNTSYLLRWDQSGVTGSISDNSDCGDSSCRTNATTLNYGDEGFSDDDKKEWKDKINHHGTVGSGISLGGIIIHGEFASATVGTDGTATIAWEASKCSDSGSTCGDSDFAGSMERWSATGIAIPEQGGSGIDFARTKVTDNWD